MGEDRFEMDSLQAKERKTLAFSLQKALFGLRAEEQLFRGAEAGVLLTASLCCEGLSKHLSFGLPDIPVR